MRTFEPKNATVQVQVSCRDEKVTAVSVADNGNGIANTKIQDTRRGIGSALFDTHCGANWQLAANQTGIGSLLTFEI
jgi:signal transduction histidine kinase